MAAAAFLVILVAAVPVLVGRRVARALRRAIGARRGPGALTVPRPAQLA